MGVPLYYFQTGNEGTIINSAGDLADPSADAGDYLLADKNTGGQLPFFPTAGPYHLIEGKDIPRPDNIAVYLRAGQNNIIIAIGGAVIKPGEITPG